MKSKLPLLRAVLFSFVAIVLLFFLFLPSLCDTYLLPRVISNLPFSEKEMSLSRISPWKISGNLRLSQDGELVASIPKFEVHYSPLALLGGTVDTLLLDGCFIQIDTTKHSSAGGKSSTSPAQNKNGESPPELPITVNDIIIRDSLVRVTNSAWKKDFPLDAQLKLNTTAEGKRYKLESIAADVAITGELNLSAQTKFNFHDDEVLLSTKFSIPDLLELSFLSKGNPMLPAGNMDGTGQLAIDSQSIAIKSASLEAVVNNFEANFHSLSLGGQENSAPVQLQLSGTGSSYHYFLHGISIQGMDRSFTLDSAGSFETATKDFTTHCDLTNLENDEHLFLEAVGVFSRGAVSTEVTLKGEKIRLTEDITSGPIEFMGNIDYQDDIFNLQLSGAVEKIVDKSVEFEAENLALKAQLQFPPAATPIYNNSFTIKNLLYKNEPLASLNILFQQNEDSLNYRAELPLSIGMQTVAKCQGTVAFAGSINSECNLPDSSFDSDNLPHFIAMPDETTFKGRVGGHGKFKREGNSSAGELTLKLADGMLTKGETTVAAIGTSLHFPSLPSLRSAPSQIATFESIESGKIHIDGGKLYYRLEEEPGLFLEKARLSWCGGKIETGALSFSPSTRNMEATLYCDRLGFAELLSQFGIEDTDGEGSLNGRLPVAFNEGRILFDDGFLFSTPGNSGIVRFTDTDQLRQGIPDISQSATLDYSIKALENFAYNWTKLTFNTEGENLLLALQLDGKPAEPLPFGYKNGQIVATEKGAGLQHPLRLDMNFRLPLQELFQYGKSLQSMMENM